jgi:hypothetical protein
MAEKKIIASTAEKTVREAKPVGNATPKRVAAWICWILALACEVLAILSLGDKLPFIYQLPFGSEETKPLIFLIAFLVIDLIFVIIANRCWIKANHIAPASEKNKAAFWLNNNLGLIMGVLCFLPIIILILTNKEADKKTKTIGTVVAVVCLLIAGVTGIDFNPISAEQLEAAEKAITTQVYWTKAGGVYHTSQACSHLNRSETLITGTVEQAVAESKTRLCKTCAKRDSINTEGVLTTKEEIEEIVTDVVEEVKDIVSEN